MAVTSQKELLGALKAAEFDRILDTPECKWLDFKSKQYETVPGKPLLLSHVGKAEPCKDVSAFANHEGGVLVLGVKEVKSRTSGLSVAGKLTPIKVEAIDLKHYKDVLMAGVYPLMEGITTKWFIVEEEKGLLAITVPKTQRGKHILRHTYDENQKLLNGLGIVQRADDLTYTYTAEALYDLLQNQKAQTVTIPRQSNLQRTIPPEVVQRITANHKAIKEKNELEAEQIRLQLLTMNDWEKLPVFILQSIPLIKEENLSNFYDKVKQAFIETTPTRTMGFNLNSIGRESDTVDGALIKSGIRDAALRLDPNGTLTLMMLASDTLLGWAMHNNTSTDAYMKINSIVLVEMVYEFVRYVHETLTKFGLSGWEYVIDIRNFKLAGVNLYEGTPGSFGVYDTSPAQKDEYVRKIARLRDYTEDSAKVLAEIYTLFALPESAIPYVVDGKITPESIKAIDASGR